MALENSDLGKVGGGGCLVLGQKKDLSDTPCTHHRFVELDETCGDFGSKKTGKRAVVTPRRAVDRFCRRCHDICDG